MSEGDPTTLGPSQDASPAGEQPAGTDTRSPVGRGGGGRRRDERPRTYYDQPVLKEPVWSPEIAVYFFTGGLAGASAVLARSAELAGNDRLARSAWLSSFAGIAVSPPLLIVDLGVPRRFLNMLRVFKLSSPMSVGTWIVSASGLAIGLATVRDVLGWFPRLGSAAGTLAAALGPSLATYTAVLITDTAVPAWHEARREMPFLFAGSAAGSAGAAATVLTPVADAGPARRLLVLGAALELATSRRIEHALGEVGEPYREGTGGRFLKLAEALTGAGAALVALRGRRRREAVAGGLLVLAGAMSTRWAVYKVGPASASDPKYVVGPQRERVQARGGKLSAPPG